MQQSISTLLLLAFLLSGTSVYSQTPAWSSQVIPLPATDDQTAELLNINQHSGNDLGELFQAYGGIAGQLAALYTFLDPVYQVEGFAIPFKYYQEFMQSNQIPLPDDPASLVSYEEFIQLLMQDSAFRNDSVYRQDKLESFIEYAREHGNVEPQLVNRILAEINGIFGSASILLRFRSSSNMLGDLQSNGTGLNESTTVCPEDNLDNDEDGPSRCDPNEEREKTIERGLKEVWTSLWSPEAFDERENAQINHNQVRMGILVTPAHSGVDANGMAYSGDPVRGMKFNYIVNVQKGDVSVNQQGTGINPEINWVNVYPGGGFVQRLQPSSFMNAGEWVLSEEQVIELGTLLEWIDQQMPLMDNRYMRKDIITEIEFKFDSGQIFIERVRTILLPTAKQIEGIPDVKLIIPENTVMAGVFVDGRSLADEYNALSILHLKAGEYDLPTQVSELDLNIIDHIEYTPEKLLLTPSSSGRMAIDIFQEAQLIQFFYEQAFSLPDGRTLNLTLRNLRFQHEPGAPAPVDFILTEDFISSEFIYAQGLPDDGDYNDMLQFRSLTYKTIPLYKHTLELSDGSRIELYRRYLIPFAASGPANLVYAVVNHQGQTVHQNDYWKLVYAAVHHNWDEKYRVILNAPIGEIHGFDVETFTFDQQMPKVYPLDTNLNRMQELSVQNYTEEEVDDLPGTPVGEWIKY